MTDTNKCKDHDFFYNIDYVRRICHKCGLKQNKVWLADTFSGETN